MQTRFKKTNKKKKRLHYLHVLSVCVLDETGDSGSVHPFGGPGRRLRPLQGTSPSLSSRSFAISRFSTYAPPHPLCRRSTSSACTGATEARRRRPRRRRGATAARAAPTWSGSTGWTGPSSRACTGCWRRGPAAPTCTLTRWPTAPSPCWTRTAATW